ncbi:uncharacterized protein DNG_00087 [Cephalotrichum gorgonifer]|uniref:Uncharacterized protein n=1 Tax=Cephalotrichum gorgonifer TaxID=2041049 RepID=A0AAE8MNN4_9PEZI|nr:uncharacterized protein DNG_00087 [Cephalotrichum gorgonifer]
MDWLNVRNDFSESDLGQFNFSADLRFSIRTFHIQRPQTDGSKPEKSFKAKEEYVAWLEQVVPSPTDRSPSLVLVVHPRITSGTEPAAQANPGVTSLRQTKDTFRKAAAHLFQHRSICDVICRVSTAVFTTHEVIWGTDNQEHGPSIVYNFMSDTESTENEDLDDLIMSVTWFPLSRKAFGTIYGCQDEPGKQVRRFMRRIEDAQTALHPLLMPMIFFELERTRLLNCFEEKQSDIYQKILEMERGLRRQVKIRDSNSGEKHSNDEADNRHEITELWMQASSQRTGIVSLKVQLGRMVEHSKWLSAEYFAKKSDGADPFAKERKVGEMIETRLQAIMAECDSKARSFDTLLGGMGLATQMEWNYHSRMDAKATYTITSLAKKDSGQMRTIAVLGMVFLPPTFLATVFSMSFFKWIPEDSNQVVNLQNMSEPAQIWQDVSLRSTEFEEALGQAPGQQYFHFPAVNVTKGTAGYFKLEWQIVLEHRSLANSTGPEEDTGNPVWWDVLDGYPPRMALFRTMEGSQLADVEAAIAPCPELNEVFETDIEPTRCAFTSVAKELAANVSAAVLDEMGCDEGDLRTITGPCPKKEEENMASPQSAGFGLIWALPALAFAAMNVL